MQGTSRKPALEHGVKKKASKLIFCSCYRSQAEENPNCTFQVFLKCTDYGSFSIAKFYGTCYLSQELETVNYLTITRGP